MLILPAHHRAFSSSAKARREAEEKARERLAEAIQAEGADGDQLLEKCCFFTVMFVFP